MLYKYLFWATYRLYDDLDSKNSGPKNKALAITSLFQLVLVIDLFVCIKKLFDLAISFSEIHVLITTLIIFGANYLWLFKLNNVDEVIDECKNLPKAKNDLYTYLVVIHLFLDIGLFILAMKLN